MTDAAAIIQSLGLHPHPEGGHYRETFRHRPDDGGRGACTAIYYLLAAGETSAWHRIDGIEIWHWYAGAPLTLSVAEEGKAVRIHHLGNRLLEGQHPQVTVAAQAWQSAVSQGEWSLVGCTVAPAFQFEGFQMAPPGWEPHG